MLGSLPVSVKVEEVVVSEARRLAIGGKSAVGHADTAAVFTNVLGINIDAVRSTVSLVKGDMVLVGQYSGPRLPEGATELPAGATVKWLKVTVM